MTIRLFLTKLLGMRVTARPVPALELGLHVHFRLVVMGNQTASRHIGMQLLVKIMAVQILIVLV